MNDMISRQAAIEATCHNCSQNGICDGKCDDTDRLRDLPTIEPKQGKWEDVEVVLYEENTGENPYTVTAVGYKCSECGTEMGYLWSFCPNCGAKMDEVEE